MKKIFLVGASSVIGNSIINNLQKEDKEVKIINISRNSEFKNNSNFVYVENYNNLGSKFNTYEPDKDDIIILAFAYLGKTGFDNNFPVSIEEQNQKKVFEINFSQMSAALNVAVNYLKKNGGKIIYLSSAAAYPVRSSNTKKREYTNKFNIDILSVRIGFVDTPLNQGRKKTPFSSTPEQVAKAVIDGLGKNKTTVYVPKALFLVTKLLTMFPKFTNYLDQKYN
jgi:short-subunit dehydrogenase